MYRYLVVLIIMAGFAGFVPSIVDQIQGSAKHRAASSPSTSDGKANVASISAGQQLPEASYLGNGRTARLQANSEGHFTAQFVINGRTIGGMVDTGATYIAMNRSTARDIGVSPSPSAYIYSVSTANGTTKAAHTLLSSVDIGQIHVANVDAFVLPDSAMADTLIGMSFLKKLSSYEVRSGVLDLKQ